jgi:[acyl-carrier-protein] S-malonyltransferase
VTALPYETAEEIPEKLIKQVVEPVQWVKSMKWLRRANVEYCVELGPGHVLQSLMKRNYSEIKVFAYDESGEAQRLKAFVEASYIPFLSRCMGLAVSARNTCWDNELYRQGVIQPYNTLRSMQERVEAEERGVTEAEMLQGAQLLKTILDTKGCPQAEQAERFADLLADTGMEQKLVLPF